MKNFVVIGTWNTKHDVLEFACQEIKKRSHRPIQLDLSTKRTTKARDVAIGDTISFAKAKLKEILSKTNISGAIAIGGGTNLFMATKLMEEIPLFVPKVIVSTMIVNSIHSFRPYKDIVYFQSPCDLGIFNPLTKDILKKAVAILTSVGTGFSHSEKPMIAITGFGISDGYFGAAESYWLKKGYHLVPFHSIGENTMAMAELIRLGLFKGILDLTLHDVIDHIGKGAYGKIGKDRLYAYLSKDVPAVMAPGGLDAIALMSSERLSPLSFKKRKRYYHDYRWCIKANKGEVTKAAKWIGEILRETNPEKAVFLVPLQGWSYPGEKGKEFHDPEVIETFKKWIIKFFRKDSVIDVNLSINDPRFGMIACEHLYRLMGNQK